MSIENMYCNESKKFIESTTFAWIFIIYSLFCFYTSLFRHLLQWVPSKVNKLVVLEVAFKASIFWVCFCHFRKHKPLFILNLFTTENLDQIPPWEELKEPFSATFQTRNLFLCKLKIKKNPGCPNKDYNAICKYIHQNIRTYSGSKITQHWSVIRKILLIGKNLNKGKRKQVKFVPNTVGRSGWIC